MRLWKRIEIGASKVSVYSVSAAEMPIGFRDGVEGISDPPNARILILNSAHKDRVLDTLLHECLHAIVESSGVGNWLAAIAKEGRWNDDEEETFVRMLTPMLLRSLVSSGWIPPRDLERLIKKKAQIK